MYTLGQVLETALQLPREQQEMLLKILQSRYYEDRRAELAEDAQESLTNFRAGQYRPWSAESAIANLLPLARLPAHRRRQLSKFLQPHLYSDVIGINFAQHRVLQVAEPPF